MRVLLVVGNDANDQTYSKRAPCVSEALDLGRRHSVVRIVCSLRRPLVVSAPNGWFPQNARLWQRVNAVHDEEVRLGHSRRGFDENVKVDIPGQMAEHS